MILPTLPWALRCWLPSFGGYNLELLRKVTALGPDEPDVEARNRQYRNDLAARVYMLSGGACYPR